MSSSNSKQPPALSKCKTYDDWLKLVRVWKMFTDLPIARQGPAIVLSLEGEAQDAVLELDESTFAAENGVDLIIARLDKLYKRDSTITKFQALESFQTFRRSSNMSILAFLNEFDKRYNKIKTHGTLMSDDLLGYLLLKAANLSNNHEELIKATMTELKYDIMKDQLKKTFSDASRQIPTSNSNDIIKTEDTLVCEGLNNISFDTTDCNNETHVFNEQYYDPYNEPDEVFQDTFYNNTPFHRQPYRNKNNLPNIFKSQPNNFHKKQQPSSFNRSRPQQYQQRQQSSPKRGRNPFDRNGIQLRCSICESINHFAQNCPDRKPHQSYDTYFTQEIVLFQSDYDEPTNLKTLVGESWNSALLDSGATNTVTGEKWLNTYLESLSELEQSNVRYNSSNNVYRFGDGQLVPALRNADIPAMLGDQKVLLNVDIVAHVCMYVIV